MAEDALEMLENELLVQKSLTASTDYVYQINQDIASVCRELRAARVAVTILGEEHDPEIKAWNDALKMVDEKMVAARTNPVSPPSQ